MVCLSRLYPWKFFKACLPQNLLSPLDTLSHFSHHIDPIQMISTNKLTSFDVMGKIVPHEFIDNFEHISNR